MRARRGLAAGFGALVLVLGITSAAWACTGSPPQISALAPQMGLAGSEVRVAGGNFAGPVELRWNSVNGPLLATAVDGASFAVPVTIPADAQPGIFYVVAVQRTSAGDVLTKVSQTFEVAAPADSGPTASAQTVPAGLWPSFSSPAMSSPSLVDSPAPASSGLPLGVGVLAVGLVTMFSGVMVAELRRRRVPASRRSMPS